MMILIKKLDCRKNKTGESIASWGLFLCPYCNKKVEKHLCNGLKAKSCGCGRIKHGESKTRLYGIWTDMKGRCLNPNNYSYKNYGSRDIKVCDEWANNFENFYKWCFANGYKDDLQIDRIDNNGDYEPNNCRFVTCAINIQNRRSNRFCMSEIIELRKICKFGGLSRKRIAMAYKISQSYLSEIINNKAWVNNASISI